MAICVAFMFPQSPFWREKRNDEILSYSVCMCKKVIYSHLVNLVFIVCMWCVCMYVCVYVCVCVCVCAHMHVYVH